MPLAACNMTRGPQEPHGSLAFDFRDPSFAAEQYEVYALLQKF